MTTKYLFQFLLLILLKKRSLLDTNRKQNVRQKSTTALKPDFNNHVLLFKTLLTIQLLTVQLLNIAPGL